MSHKSLAKLTLLILSLNLVAATALAQRGGGGGVPVGPPRGCRYIEVAAGANHSLALRDDGTVWAWGQNTDGELGNASNEDSITPVQVSGLTNIIDISAGTNYSLAVAADGSVWSWGANDWGKLGDGTDDNKNIPVEVTGPSGVGHLSNITKVSAGENHSLALSSDGNIFAWGDNDNGQLGDGTYNWSITPVQVINVSNATSIAAGENHSLALTADGSVWSWGWDLYGQLGNGQSGVGTGNGIATPAVANTQPGVTAIAAGATHSIAINADGTISSWGQNNFRQLGDTTFTDNVESNPGTVSDLTGVTAISAGGNFSIAMESDGSVWTFGEGSSGQLGDGTFDDHSIAPVEVEGLTGGVDAPALTNFSAGGKHALGIALFTIGSWGSNESGQLGYGTVGNNSNTVTESNIVMPACGASSGGNTEAFNGNLDIRCNRGLDSVSLDVPSRVDFEDRSVNFYNETNSPALHTSVDDQSARVRITDNRGYGESSGPRGGGCGPGFDLSVQSDGLQLDNIDGSDYNIQLGLGTVDNSILSEDTDPDYSSSSPNTLIGNVISTSTDASNSLITGSADLISSTTSFYGNVDFYLDNNFLLARHDALQKAPHTDPATPFDDYIGPIPRGGYSGTIVFTLTDVGP